MRSITLTPSRLSAGAEAAESLPLIYGSLPESFADVKLAHYVILVAADRVSQRIAATALICGLPVDVLLADAGLFATIKRAAPWLFADPPLSELKRQSLITHEGMRYEFVGDLHRISAHQLEALLDFIAQHHAAPILSAASLLAVLYKPLGEAQTADVVERTALAFESLPVSIAWPAIMDFLRSGASVARHIRNSSALVSETKELLSQLESASRTGGASFRYLSKLRRWLILTWIRSARAQL